MKIYGITELLINGKTVFKKHNDITTWVQRATLQGNFANGLLSSKLYPLRQWFGGCFLFDKNMDSNLIVETCVPTDEAVIVAQAGDVTNYNTQGGLPTMGSYMDGLSGAVEQEIENVKYKGWRNVWQWAQAITLEVGAVALTRANNGQCPRAEVFTDTALNDHIYPFEVLSDNISASSTDSNINNIVSAINLIDYEKELGFIIEYDYNSGAGTVRIRTYKMNTKQVHLDGETACIIPQSASKYEIEDVSFDTNTNIGLPSFTYTGDYIFLYNTDVDIFTVIKIKLEDWTWTVSNHNLTSLGGVNSRGVSFIEKDVIPMEYEETNGTPSKWNAWIIQRTLNVSAKYYKVDLLTDTLIKEYTRPDAGIHNDYHRLLPCIMLPNGDFFRWQTGHDIAPYYSKADDKFYAVWCPTGTNIIPADPQGIMGCGKYGTAIIKANNSMRLVEFFPYISTINNLPSQVIKNAGDTMRLEYTILEREESEE